MKERILTNWTFTRVLYLVIGGVMVIQALANGQWFFSLWGAYFAAMGLFGFGCASGSCANVTRTAPHTKHTISEPEFEELKTGKNG